MIDIEKNHRIRNSIQTHRCLGKSTVCSKAGESLRKSWTESLHVGEGLNGSQLASCYR